MNLHYVYGRSDINYTAIFAVTPISHCYDLPCCCMYVSLSLALRQPPFPHPPDLTNCTTPMRGRLRLIQAYITSLE